MHEIWNLINEMSPYLLLEFGFAGLLLGKNVDLVEDGTLKSFAVESANRDKKLIYERAS